MAYCFVYLDKSKVTHNFFFMHDLTSKLNLHSLLNTLLSITGKMQLRFFTLRKYIIRKKFTCLNIFYGLGFSSVSLGEQMMLNLSSSITQVQSQDCLDLHKKFHKTFLQLRFPPSYFFLKKPALSGINRQWKPPCFKMSR